MHDRFASITTHVSTVGKSENTSSARLCWRVLLIVKIMVVEAPIVVREDDLIHRYDEQTNLDKKKIFFCLSYIY